MDQQCSIKGSMRFSKALGGIPQGLLFCMSRLASDGVFHLGISD